MNYEWITDGGIDYFVVNGVEVDSMCWGGFGIQNIGECWFDASGMELSPYFCDAKKLIENRYWEKIS